MQEKNGMLWILIKCMLQKQKEATALFFVCLFSINQHHITKIYLSSRYTYSKSKHIKDESAILCLFGRYRTTEKPGLSGATTNAQDTNGRDCTAVDCISAKSK